MSTIPWSRDPMNEVQISQTVMFYDTDCGGVVSNIAYLRMVERARSALFESLGMDAAEMMKSQVFPAVIRTEIDYRRPARLGDEVIVSASFESVAKVRAICQFRLEIAGEQENQVSAEARQVVALVQMPSGRPKRMPSEWVSSVT